MPKTPDITIEGERFRLQRISNEIKAIGDRSTLLLGYLVIVLAALTAFTFTDLSDPANQMRILSTALLAIYSLNACSVLGILAISFESGVSNKPETLKILQEKINASFQRLFFLKIWFIFNLLIAFTSLISVLSFAIYSLV